MLLMGLKKAVAILGKCHVLGDEAKAFGEAMEILEAFIKVLEDGEKEDKKNEDHAEHGQGV